VSKDDLHRLVDQLDEREAADLVQALRLLVKHGDVVLAAQVEELRRHVTDINGRLGFVEGKLKGLEPRLEDLARRTR